MGGSRLGGRGLFSLGFLLFGGAGLQNFQVFFRVEGSGLRVRLVFAIRPSAMNGTCGCRGVRSWGVGARDAG